MLEEALLSRKKSNTIEANDPLAKLFLHECVGLLIKKQKISREEAISIFYEALILFYRNYNHGKFTYTGDAELKSYLKTTCLNKAREYKREVGGSKFIVDTNEIENKLEHYEAEFDALQQETYKQKKNAYGIALDTVKETSKQQLPVSMIAAFHQLKDKCKLLIVLRVLLNVDHSEIVRNLSLFYTMKNENVSKNTLKRCKAQWRKLSETS